jgi:mRNA interferase MazF
VIIRQGDIFIVDLGEPVGSEPGYVHPVVIIQNNVTNKSRIKTVLACPLSTTLKLKNSPGNVLLIPGEANLREQSVVNVSQIITLDKRDLHSKIGSLHPDRVRQIIEGVNILIEPRNL